MATYCCVHSTQKLGGMKEYIFPSKAIRVQEIHEIVITSIGPTTSPDSTVSQLPGSIILNAVVFDDRVSV